MFGSFGRGGFPGRWHPQPSGISRPLHHRPTLRYGSPDRREARGGAPWFPPLSVCLTWPRRVETEWLRDKRERGGGLALFSRSLAGMRQKQVHLFSISRRHGGPEPSLYSCRIYTWCRVCLPPSGSASAAPSRECARQVRHKQELCVSV